MQEILYPEKKQYYFIINEGGKVLTEGIVNTNETLSTSDKNTIYYSDNRLDVINQIENKIGKQDAFNDILSVNVETGEYYWGQGFEEALTFYVFAMPSVAEPLSRALYEVVNPGSEGLYARVYEHEDPEQYAILEFRKTDVVPISLGANQTPLADALAITVQDGALTQAEVDGIVNAISAYAGQEVNLVDFIPPSWADKQISKREAILLGYDI